MAKTLSQIVKKRNCLTLSESIQITKKLLKMTEKIHTQEANILVLFPDNIQVENVDGEYQLQIGTDDMDDTNTQKKNSNNPDDQIVNYQIAAIESIGFRAPELAVTDITRIGKQTDYYSITAIFYYCITGKKISRFQMFYSGVPDISEVIYRNCMDKRAAQLLYQILKKGLAPTLKNRYQSGKQMENDLIKLQKYVR